MKQKGFDQNTTQNMTKVFWPDNIEISQEKFVAILQEWPVIPITGYYL